MARVMIAKKNRAGKNQICGRAGCGQTVQPGEKYFYWEPRYGGKQVRCFRHSPRRSETTTSKMSEVYAAVEGAEDTMASSTFAPVEASDFSTLLTEVAEVTIQTKDEYEEAAEHFGGQGPSQEAAEQLEEFISELEGADIPEFNDWWKSHMPDEMEEDAKASWVEECESQVSEILGSCP